MLLPIDYIAIRPTYAKTPESFLLEHVYATLQGLLRRISNGLSDYPSGKEVRPAM